MREIRASITIPSRSGGFILMASLLTLLTSCSSSSFEPKNKNTDSVASYTISTNSGLNGNISPSSATVNNGESANFTIAADTGFTINSVSGCGGALTDDQFTTRLIDRDCTITASFSSINSVTYFVNTAIGANGSVSPASTVVNRDDTTSFTITPENGFSINSVTGCGGTLVNNIYTTGVITNDCTVIVTFSMQATSFTVSTIAGLNGTISPTSTIVSTGANTSVTITPDSGFDINSVTGCGGTLTGNTYTTANITNNCTVTASFIPTAVTFTVSTAAGVNGAISPNSAIVNNGNSTSFTVTPDLGFDIKSVTGCGGTVTGNTYTTASITNDCTVTASFSPTIVSFTVSTAAGVNGVISPTSATVNNANTTSFTITPDIGFDINSVTGCGGTLVGNIYTTSAITMACTVTASFVAIVSHIVSTDAGNDGTISPPEAIVINNDVTTFTITPDSGFGIISATGCNGALIGNTYTTAAIIAPCTVAALFDVVHTVTTNVDRNGNIFPVTALVLDGNKTTFTITPDQFYDIDKVSGCEGSLSGNQYTTESLGGDCSISVSFIAATTYIVTANAGLNGTVSPVSTTLLDGDSTIVTVTPDTGYAIDVVTGCGGTLLGNAYTTSSVTADCAINASFKFIPIVLPTVNAFYGNNGTNWNDYVKNDGINNLSATDIAVDGLETGGYHAIIHGGEIRVVSVVGKNSCTGLTAQDSLNAFDWICLADTSPVRIVSTGLKSNKNLSDLVDFVNGTWRSNRVAVSDGNVVYAESSISVWWSNPIVVDNNGTDGLDMVEGEIRIINVAPVATYTFGQNKVALLVDPTVTLTGSATLLETLITASGFNYLWIEGKLDINNDTTGIDLSNTNFSVLRNINTLYGTNGITLSSSSNNLLTNIKSSSNNSGLFVTGGSNNHITNTRVLNTTEGIVLALTSNNTLTKVMAANNNDGIRLSGATNNVLSQITVANNTNAGIFVNLLSSDNTLSEITSTNNNIGLNINNSSNIIMSQITASNNATGISITASSSNTLSNLTATDNGYGISLATSSNNTFTGRLQVGNSLIGDCLVIIQDSVNPGLDDDIATGANDAVQDGVCLQQGSSNFGTALTGATLAVSFVNKLNIDDTTNISDANGQVASLPIPPAFFDWTNFDNAYRSWGIEGSVFPASNHQGKWNTGAGRIWDWSLLNSDTVIRNGLSLSTSNDTLTHIWSNNSAITYLLNAAEIQGDNIGNDNGLCESDEICLYTPNMGSYQGHGALISAGLLTNGALTNIMLLRYSINGR